MRLNTSQSKWAPGFHNGWHECPTCEQQYTGAMKLGLAEALWARQQRRPAEDDHRLCAQNTLAIAYQQAGRLAAAETLYRDVLATRRRVDGPNHDNTLLVAGNLGGVLSEQGKDSAAEAVYRDTLERERAALARRRRRRRRRIALSSRRRGASSPWPPPRRPVAPGRPRASAQSSDRSPACSAATGRPGARRAKLRRLQASRGHAGSIHAD